MEILTMLLQTGTIQNQVEHAFLMNVKHSTSTTYHYTSHRLLVVSK